MPFGRLAADLANARAGETYLIGFPAAREAPLFWDAPVMIQARGSARAPVRVEAGVAAASGAVKPMGGARHGFVNRKRLAGAAPFRIAGGSAHLSLAGFNIEGAPADGFLKFMPGVSTNIHVAGLQVREVGRVIETDRGAELRDVVIEACDATGLVRGFARFRALSNAVLRDLSLDAALRDGGGDQICQIIAIESGANVRFEGVNVRRAVNLRGDAYAQGDGIVCEARTRDFHFTDCHGAEMGDAAFDLKTVNVTLEDCTATQCKFGVRVWSTGRNVMRRCAITSPRRVGSTSGACVECKGRLEIVDSRLQAGAGAAIFRLDQRGDGMGAIVMRGGSIQLDRGAALAVGEPGGVVELIDVAVNGQTQRRRVAVAERAP